MGCPHSFIHLCYFIFLHHLSPLTITLHPHHLPISIFLPFPPSSNHRLPLLTGFLRLLSIPLPSTSIYYLFPVPISLPHNFLPFPISFPSPSPTPHSFPPTTISFLSPSLPSYSSSSSSPYHQPCPTNSPSSSLPSSSLLTISIPFPFPPTISIPSPCPSSHDLSLLPLLSPSLTITLLLA